MKLTLGGKLACQMASTVHDLICNCSGDSEEHLDCNLALLEECVGIGGEVFLSVRLFFLSIYLYVCLSVCVFACVSVCVSVYPFVYLYMARMHEFH